MLKFLYLSLFILPLLAMDFIKTPTKDIVKSANGDVQLGWAKIILEKEIIVFPATYIAAVDDELQELEVLIANDWGRVHESLFKTKVSALHLSVLLTLLGLKKDDLIDIKVIPTLKGKSFFIENWLFDKRTNKEKVKTGWLFVADEKYLEEANSTGNIALLFSSSPATVFDCNDKESEKDWLFKVNENNKVLKVNQQVMLMVSKRKKK